MDITLLDDQIENGEFRVEPGQSLHLNLASFSGFPNHEIYVKVLSNGVFKAAFADFSKGSGKLKVYIDLAGEGASAEWHCASICDGTSEKVLDVNLIHSAQHTKGLVSNYGISEDAARLSFLGTSEIKKGAAGSSTRQVAKIVVFDEGCIGKAMPILKIDENDVSASHAAVVGKLNESHLFYLTSRGIPLAAARRLLTLGYLKPIESHFEDEALRKKIDEAIEGGI